MKQNAFLMFCVFAVSQLPVLGALIVVDLSSDGSYQNQFTPPPAPPVSGVNISSKDVSISNITVGGGTYSLDFTISDALGSSGLIERYVRLDSRLNDVELIFSAGPPEHATALAEGNFIDASSDWYITSDKDMLLTRFVVILGSDTSQGQWLDGQEHYAGFRFLDGASYHYGFIGITITNYDSTPTLSISGYTYESTPNQGVTITGISIPEPASAAALMGVGGLFFVAGRWMQRRREIKE